MVCTVRSADTACDLGRIRATQLLSFRSTPAERVRLLRDATWILGLACTALAVLYVWFQGLGADSHAYWLAWHGPM